MDSKNYTGIVPDHSDGKVIDTHESVELPSTEAAKQFYSIARNRLLQVNQWHELAGVLSARFQLTDEEGNPVERMVQQGDHFKIDIPGPGSITGDGYDWVRVEAVEEVSKEGVDSVGVRVRPATNPTNRKDDIAHFYSAESTSNFILSREGKKVTMSVLDRNTKANDDADNLVDQIRDTAVGATALGFFSRIQWTNLAKGIVDLRKEK